MQKLLSKVSLGDRYEIQTRLLPGMLVVIPVIVLVLQFEYAHKSWLRALAIGGGLELFLAFLFAKLAHAMGRHLEGKLIAQWGGLPTHRWLRPTDQSHSVQQKALWRASLAKLSGIDLDAAIATGDTAELDRAIGDAILNTRNVIRGRRETTMLQTSNCAYGFARNIAGLRMVALAVAAITFLIVAIFVYRGDLTLSGLLVQGLFLVASLGFYFYGVTYVRHCSDRYAEFFFTTITKIADGKRAKKTGVTSASSE